MMFASFVVTLRPVKTASIGNSTGKSLHGLFFSLLGEENQALFEQIHSGSETRPVTVSPLRGVMQRQDFRRLIMPNQLYSVRYTTLSDELFNALSKILLRKFIYRGKVDIDGVEFVVQDVAVEPDKSRGWGMISSAEEIWERAAVGREVTLYFASPTAFKQKELNLVFPVPKNVFYSYRDKWNKFAPVPIDDGFVPWVEENVAVEAHDLATRMVWFSDFQKQGFVGRVRYVARNHDVARLKQLNALADYAFFCGTGQKTAQGMGQTRRMPKREPFKDTDDESVDTVPQDAAPK
jgi:CRISPR-associated endoribonuclease Cas6